MKINKTSTILYILILIATYSGCASTIPKETLVSQFKQARIAGSVPGMRSVFEKMVSRNIIKKGMPMKKVTVILGKGQNWTGIYTPGGTSVGYGNKKPTSQNHPDFFWLNFRAPDWEGKNELPPVLINWN